MQAISLSVGVAQGSAGNTDVMQNRLLPISISRCFAMQSPSIGLVRKYTRARKLTPRMLNELVEKIEVFNAEKIDGVWEQRLRIHYNCVGTIEIPTVLPLPIPEVSVNTRKGVVVNYAPCELAV